MSRKNARLFAGFKDHRARTVTKQHHGAAVSFIKISGIEICTNHQRFFHVACANKLVGHAKGIHEARTGCGKIERDGILQDTFVLDFVNTREDIQKAFEDYYVSTTVEETTDPNTIYEFKDYLDGFMIYSEKEVNDFSKIFFKSKKKQGNIDLGILNSVLDPVVERYNEIEGKEEQYDFKYVLNKFVRLYAFLTHIINLQDENLHKFYVFAKGLIRKLPKEEGEQIPDIASDVNLQYYRIQKEFEGSINLSADGGSLNNPTSGTGIPAEEEKEKLSEIIKDLNARLGTDFTEMDKVLEQIVADAANNEELVLRAKNPLDLFKIIYKEKIMDIVLDRMTQNQEFALKYLEDEEFRNEIDRILLPLLHERLSGL